MRTEWNGHPRKGALLVDIVGIEYFPVCRLANLVDIADALEITRKNP